MACGAKRALCMERLKYRLSYKNASALTGEPVAPFILSGKAMN